MSPVVSVVVTTYNRANLVSRCVESILAQTYSNLEVLVIDDGSTDGTHEKLAGFATDTRFRLMHMPKNGGASGARNYGIKMATGDFILVFDSDDILDRHALEYIMNIFTHSPEYGTVAAVCRQMRNDVIVPYTPLREGPLSLNQILCRALPLSTKIRVSRRTLFETVRYEARNLDFMVNGYLATQAPWYHVAEELGTVYLESDSQSLTTARKKPNWQRSAERAEPLARYLERFKDELQSGCRERYGALSYGAAVAHLARGLRSEAVTWAQEAVRVSPTMKHRAVYVLTRLPLASYILRLVFLMSSLRVR